MHSKAQNAQYGLQHQEGEQSLKLASYSHRVQVGCQYQSLQRKRMEVFGDGLMILTKEV